MLRFAEWLFEKFLARYWKSRKWSCLWKGLPAFICMILGVSALAAVRRPNESDLSSRLDTVATSARESGMDAVEDLCRRRQLALQPTDPRTRYQYAESLAHRGEEGRAMRIIQSMAPLNRSGYAPAQFWLAEKMMVKKTPLSPSEINILEQRLELSVLGRDAVTGAHLPLVDLAVRTGKWDVATQHLEAVVARRPDLLMNLAFAYRQQGNESRATLNADRGTGFYTALLRGNPKDDASRLRLAETLVFQRKLREAIEVLQAAEGAESDPKFGAAIAQVFLLRMTGLGSAPSTDGPNSPADASRPANKPISTLEMASRIELLAQALHYGPHHPGVLTAIAQLSTEDSPDGDRARSWLKDALASGKAPATVHLVLGTAAASKGDLSQATFHLEQANLRDPKLAEAANNLAYVLARTDPPRTEEALRLVEAALKGMPRHPEMHETRGQILLLMGQTKDAILELEFVLEKLPNHSEAHRGLATAYRLIGDQELADRHLQIADRLKSDRGSSKSNR